MNSTLICEITISTVVVQLPTTIISSMSTTRNDESISDMLINKPNIGHWS